MAVSVSELIEEIGNDTIRVQHIRQSTVSVKRSAKYGDNEVTFCTDQLTPEDLVTGGGKVGLVVWFTQEQYDTAMANVKARKDNQ